MSFDVLDAIWRYSPRDLSEITNQIESPCTLVGLFESGREAVLMAETGAVFVGADDYCALAGDNPDDALETLCRGARFA